MAESQSQTSGGSVVVVGGGPAGLAAAVALRQGGFEVRVLERSHPPIDKACGEGLMPDGLASLSKLGVRLNSQRMFPLRGIRYLDGPWTAEGRFPAGPGAGVRRLDLHKALVKRAQELGVVLDWGTKVEGLDSHDDPCCVRTSEGSVPARWIIGADGLRSRVRQWAGFNVDGLQELKKRRFGVRRHFCVAPWSDCVEVYWADGCEAYVTPLSSSEVGVAILWSGRKARFDDLMEAFPQLQGRLEGAESTSRDRGAGPLLQRVHQVARGRVALIGDASGYVDAITGEGLSLAFHQSTALVESLQRNQLRHYAKRHRQIAALPDGMTRLLLAIEARPWLRRRVIGALAKEPTLFSRFLAVHSRQLPVHRLGLATGPRLLWHLVSGAS